MFSRVMIKQWSDIENTIGRDKIYSVFLMNRLTLTCAITLYHIDDVASYLAKYEHVTNQIACIVRCFTNLEFLKVLYCTGALIGLHLVEPFLSFTTSTSTKHAPVFKQLYKDLSTTDSNRLLNVHSPALSFVSSTLKPEILKVLSRLLPKLEDGFQNRKRVLFGFENTIKESLHALANMGLAKLERSPIHNFDVERSFGFINYELSHRVAMQLKLASSSQVKSKSPDLIERRESRAFRQYTKLTKSEGRVPDIIKEWHNSQQQLIVE
uniref:Uncharacterized protein n=1 Tax=Octopus bimaculoides TaxID=37653 RepID=A0A0L8GZT1_OCTBM